MSRKLSRRLCIEPKCKLNFTYSLPEPVCDASVDGVKSFTKEKGLGNECNPYLTAGICDELSTQHLRFDSFNATESESDFSLNDGYDSVTCDEDEFWESGEDAESSSLGQSAASFMSWSDEVSSGDTERLQKLFEDVDHALYREKHNSLPQNVLEECSNWSAQHPYLRVLGRRLPTLPSNQESPLESTSSTNDNVPEFALDPGHLIDYPLSSSDSLCPDSDGGTSVGDLLRSDVFTDGASEWRNHVERLVKRKLYDHLWPWFIRTYKSARLAQSQNVRQVMTSGANDNRDIKNNFTDIGLNLGKRTLAGGSGGKIQNNILYKEIIPPFKYSSSIGERGIALGKPHSMANRDFRRFSDISDSVMPAISRHKQRQLMLQEDCLLQQNNTHKSAPNSPPRSGRYRMLPPIDWGGTAKSLISPRYQGASSVSGNFELDMTRRPSAFLVRNKQLSPLRMRPSPSIERVRLEQLLEKHLGELTLDENTGSSESVDLAHEE